MTVSSAAVIVLAARRLGVDLSEWIAAHGYAPERLKSRDERFPVALLYQLWEHALGAAGDDLPALAGQTHTMESYGVVGYLALTSPTLGVGIERLLRYYRVITPAHSWSRLTAGAETVMRFSQPSPRTPGHRGGAEAALVAWLRGMREASGQDLIPTQVRVSHGRPRSTAAMDAYVRAPVAYGQPHDELQFPNAWLELPTRQAHPALSNYFEEQAKALLAKFPVNNTVVATVRRLLAEAMRGEPPTVERVAGSLGVSVRTLHRKLQDEGASYQGLLDDVRRDLACAYLQNPAIVAGEVSYLLGFSDPRAFNRAFKRWTGRTPGEFRSAA